MSTRTLWFVPLLLVCGAAVLGLGPYKQLATKMKPPGTFDEAPAKSVEDAKARIAALGDEGLALYRRHFWTDPIFIVLNLAAFGIALAVILPQAGFPKALMLLPFGAAVFDIVENVAVKALLHGEPTESLVAVARCATFAKMGCFLGMLVVILAGALTWIHRRGRNEESAGR